MVPARELGARGRTTVAPKAAVSTIARNRSKNAGRRDSAHAREEQIIGDGQVASEIHGDGNRQNNDSVHYVVVAASGDGRDRAIRRNLNDARVAGQARYKQPKSKYWWYKFTWNSEPIRQS
ncbi:MAG TPA: hypothetical protein VKB88_14210, partial [Bryobacteraceae bacterium]|nr:hypothetical protein [Bryobacteraceae bacterium]